MGMGHAGLFFLENKTGGFHYEGLSDATSKAVQITKAPDANGVYEAIVEIGGKTKKSPSTFFPKSWSPEKFIDTIEEAYEKRVLKNGNTYRAITSSGIIVEMYIDPTTSKIISALPKM